MVLVNILIDQSCDFGLRQLAGVLFKQFCEIHWSQNSEKFVKLLKFKLGTCFSQVQGNRITMLTKVTQNLKAKTSIKFSRFAYSI